MKKVVIVGGVAGGASAAARLRRLDESAEIIILERGEHISYANCGLPYYVGGKIKERSRLLVQTPKAMKSRFNIDVRTNSEVVAIDRNARVVIVKDLTRGTTYNESYDFLVLSPGASPIKPPIPGIDSPNVFVLRNIPDTDRMKSFVDGAGPRHATVVGGGFIGIEIAENLREKGLDVTIVEIADQVLGFLDYEMACLVHDELRAKGIDLRLNDGVTRIEQSEEGTEVILQSGARLRTDMVALGIGVRPESSLAAAAGLATAPNGAIIVDEHLRTSDESIFAVGDAIQVTNFCTGEPCHIPLAGPANKQGRIVADIISGIESKYRATQGTSVVKVFDAVAASTGVNEKTLRRSGTRYHAIHIHPGAHAGYYPGASAIALKLLFAPDGKILGAQAVGTEGVDKRIDVIATAMRLGARVADLEELELAYAPPFSSAKDPVNMAGYVASNVLAGRVAVAQWSEILNYDPATTVVLDVRTAEERRLGFVPGSVNIPVDDLRTRLNELPKDKEIIVYCQVGLRAYIACRILTQNGFTRVRNLSGGWKTLRPTMPSDQTSAQASAQPPTDSSTSGTCANEAGNLPDTGDSHRTGDSATGAKDATSEAGAGGATSKAVAKETTGKAVAEEAIGGAIAEASASAIALSVDACGLQCPGPIMQLAQGIKRISEGQLLRIDATDPGFGRDVSSWCENTGNTLVSSESSKGKVVAIIRKGRPQEVQGPQGVQSSAVSAGAAEREKTLVVFSGDLDKAIASFIIANGAASMNSKVTMFFTFWGLNILRKPEGARVKKPLLDTVFGWMMPRGSKRLGLSKMNLLGMGPKMIRMVMQQKNVESLEALIGMAKMNGVRMVACQMSMDVMGIRPEELIDGVEVGGVATYLSSADRSNVNLFI